AYEHFQDPEWDGEPLAPVTPVPRPKPPEGGDPEPEPPEQPDGDDGDAPERVFVKLADGKERQVKYVAATHYWFEGQQVTAQEFMQRLFGDLSALIGGEDELRDKWSDPDLRNHFLSVLEDKGYDHGRLEEMRRLIDAKNSDIFDVLAYVRFSLPPKTLHERA